MVGQLRFRKRARQIPTTLPPACLPPIRHRLYASGLRQKQTPQGPDMPLNPRLVEDFIHRIRSAMPGELDDATAISHGVRENVREALSAFLGSMDLVTREEFEVQSELLNRAYARIERLEAKLTDQEQEDAARPD